MKPCKRCGMADRRPTLLYCTACKKTVLKELASKGAFTWVPTIQTGAGRTRDHRENTYETKRGLDR